MAVTRLELIHYYTDRCFVNGAYDVVNSTLRTVQTQEQALSEVRRFMANSEGQTQDIYFQALYVLETHKIQWQYFPRGF